ncbi:acylneuraminate cytidylyltransferase family protein [Chitinophaga sp.]|uniref:acylneuraminate cytidylyltransferase family protein n=1 Tax=Chitinophaga sp. TaxID=1869181 RepID=UPI002F9577EC
MKPLFIIPARGGSKGIPGKNIKLLNKKPLIYYSIDIARMLTHDDNICVSTDDQEIINKVKDYGLKVPFKRPAELATDTIGTYDVCLHALDFYEKKGQYHDIIVVLQPTSPFRKVSDVRKALDLYNAELEMIVSVKETTANPYYLLFEENENGFLVKSKPGDFVRRQDCPKVWEYNGAVYVINVEAIKSKSISQFERIKKMEMDEYASVDLDVPLDWLWAEFLIEQGLIGENLTDLDVRK